MSYTEDQTLDKADKVYRAWAKTILPAIKELTESGEPVSLRQIKLVTGDPHGGLYGELEWLEQNGFLVNVGSVVCHKWVMAGEREEKEIKLNYREKLASIVASKRLCSKCNQPGEFPPHATNVCKKCAKGYSERSKKRASAQLTFNYA